MKKNVITTEEDNFTGIIDNIGVKDIFYEYLSYEKPNTCFVLHEDGLKSFECSLRLKGCSKQLFEELSFCNIFKG